MPLQFCSLASSSKGNSIYIGTKHTKILIDAGINCRRIEESLCGIGISPQEITAIFITHEHSDHMKGVALFSQRYQTPIYGTKKTLDSIRLSSKTKIAPEKQIAVTPYQVITVNDLQLYPYSIPHDAGDPVCYTVFDGKSKISMATDLGHIPPKLDKILKNSDLIFLESNHDVRMLENGSYPHFLKKRILGNYGHLSNETCGRFLVDLVSEKLRYVFLSHLSQENNTESLAYQTVTDILKENRIDTGKLFKLSVSPAYQTGRFVEL